MDLTLEALEKVLTDLKKVSEVESSAAASRDGLMRKEIMPMGQHGKLVATCAGLKALLIVLTTPDAGPGPTLLELDKASGSIKEFL